MSIAVVPESHPGVVHHPLAREMRAALELSREALARVPVEPWGDLEGPSLAELIARIDRVLRSEPPAPRTFLLRT